MSDAMMEKHCWYLMTGVQNIETRKTPIVRIREEDKSDALTIELGNYFDAMLCGGRRQAVRVVFRALEARG
jgi:hypothetical protein